MGEDNRDSALRNSLERFATARGVPHDKIDWDMIDSEISPAENQRVMEDYINQIARNMPGNTQEQKMLAYGKIIQNTEAIKREVKVANKFADKPTLKIPVTTKQPQTEYEQMVSREITRNTQAPFKAPKLEGYNDKFNINQFNMPKKYTEKKSVNPQSNVKSYTPPVKSNRQLQKEEEQRKIGREVHKVVSSRRQELRDIADFFAKKKNIANNDLRKIESDNRKGDRIREKELEYLKAKNMKFEDEKIGLLYLNSSNISVANKGSTVGITNYGSNNNGVKYGSGDVKRKSPVEKAFGFLQTRTSQDRAVEFLADSKISVANKGSTVGITNLGYETQTAKERFNAGMRYKPTPVVSAFRLLENGREPIKQKSERLQKAKVFALDFASNAIKKISGGGTYVNKKGEIVENKGLLGNESYLKTRKEIAERNATVLKTLQKYGNAKAVSRPIFKKDTGKVSLSSRYVNPENPDRNPFPFKSSARMVAEREYERAAAYNALKDEEYLANYRKERSQFFRS